MAAGRMNPKKWVRKSEYKDRVFKLANDSEVLTWYIRSTNKPKDPLLSMVTGSPRGIRYSKNMSSPFEDEQVGTVLLEPIIFEDGRLVVLKTNPALQDFLDVHPDLGKVFVEEDLSKDAKEDVETMNLELDALIKARELNLSEMEEVGRVIIGDIQTKTTDELKRDVFIYVRQHPNEFLNILDDPELKLLSKVQQFFDIHLLKPRNNGQEIFMNTTTSKGMLLRIPPNMDKIRVTADFLRSEQAVEALKVLELELKEYGG